MDRRTFIAAGLASAALLSKRAQASETPEAMKVYKDPGCPCCGGWVDAARRHGFEVEVEENGDMTATKLRLGVPEALASCHTIVFGRYVLEGHVPMEAIDKLVREKPEIAGLAVPGMPMGSPGMGDDPKARYDVVSFGGPDGATGIYYRAGGTEI